VRADRLLSILMYLQVRGRMTAHELAEELEVSERTVYRDLEALNAAGVPVLAERGPGGGCELPEAYRSNLTGLTEAEVRGLFLSAVPGPLVDLGLGKAVEAAMLKLTASLPEAHRRDVEQMRQRVHVDTAQWFRPEEPVPFLKTVQEAVWQSRWLNVTYRRTEGTRVKRCLEAYGLAAKANVWYVVAAIVTQAPAFHVSRIQGARRQIQVYRVSRILAAELMDQRFERPKSFDLPSYWDAWCSEFEASLPQYHVRLRVAPDYVSRLPLIYGEGVRALIDRAEPPDSEGWITLTLTFESPEAACGSVLGLGTGAEVLEPLEMRDAVLAMAGEVVEFYARRETIDVMRDV
jgi:predicted DNA-binding transcriptional regulator YafY